MVGLLYGYCGLIAQNHGEEKNAAGHYVRAISIVRRLGEQRAYALFQRHYATLRVFLTDDNNGRRQIDLAISVAESATHKDMSYRARLLKAEAVRKQPSATARERRKARDLIGLALDYSELTDSHRVRLEANAALGRIMLTDGEMEGALRATSDALALAARHGNMLQKISLRVQLAEVLIRRGDSKSGRAMLATAEKLSARIGYNRMAERIQRIDLGEALEN